MELAAGRLGSVEEAAAATASSFEALLRAHHLAAFRLALVMLQDRGEAEDSVQSAALLAWRHLDSLRSCAAERARFLTIVANCCRTLRRQGRWANLSRDHPPAPAAPDDGDRALDVRRAIARLPHRQRLVVVLRFYLDLPFAEIAAIVGITEEAARARAHRALVRLEGHLAATETIS